MAFECPSCHEARSLAVVKRVEVKPPAPSVETSVQLVECKDCHFKALALYQESGADAAESEVVSHRGYSLDAAGFEVLSQIIKDCPDRLNRRCRCPSHVKLDEFASSGKWPGKSEKSPFTLRISSK